MEIKFKDELTTTLENLDVGAVFKYKDNIYIKTNDEDNGWGSIVVNLATGNVDDMDFTTKIKPLNAVLEIY